MLSQLLLELGHVPFWTLWCLANLVAAVVLLAVLGEHVRTGRAWHHVVLLVAIAILAAAVGLIVAIAVTIVTVIERRTFRALLEQRHPARKIH